ncbi:D-hexose-6-phosphate mutarotase [Mariniluteicoccus flavus]
MFERIEETVTQLGHCQGTVPATPNGDDSASAGRFKVFDHGAHITTWSPDATPVLFLSGEALFQAGKAIRGGIPICFPWFADGRDGHAKPAHGPARLARWRLDHVDEVDGVTSLEWRLDEADLVGLPGADAAPRHFEAICRQRFGDRLEVAFSVRNTGEASFGFETALHTYFHVGDVERVSLDGLAGSDFLDKVTGATDTQRGAVTFTGETDRVYDSTATVTIVDPALGRRIVVEKENSATTVVWNPGAEKARGIADLADAEWRQFVCVETANAGEAAIRLTPGESHVMRLVVGVEAL